MISILLLTAIAVPLLAQDIEIPVKTQWSLICKLLPFDRNLTFRSGDKIVIGIFYQDRYRLSLNVKNEMCETIEKNPDLTIAGLPCKYVALDLGNLDSIDSLVSAEGVNLAYVAPLRAVDLTTITDLCRKSHILSITGVPEYVEQGISLGFGLKGDKPTILINREASYAEGADFSSQLLKLAKAVK